MNQIELGSAASPHSAESPAPSPVRARRILAIDPGSERSGWVLYDPATRSVDLAGGETDDVELISMIRARSFTDAVLAFEVLAPWGQIRPELISTTLWCGRFAEAWLGRGGEVAQATRTEVKVWLLGQSKGNDGDVNAALREIHGGARAAVGTKAAPGPLYTVRSHAWAALGVAVTVAKIPPAAFRANLGGKAVAP